MAKVLYSGLHRSNHDPIESEFNTLAELREIAYKLKSNRTCVYLISVNDEEYVADSLQLVLRFAELPLAIIGNVFIQEYESFEDAYAVALMMKEPHPLCYDNKHNLN